MSGAQRKVDRGDMTTMLVHQLKAKFCAPLRQWSVCFALGFGVLSILFAFAASASAETTGYKVFGQAGIAISIADNPLNGRHDTSFTVVARNAEDCFKLGDGVEALERICEKMGKEGLSRLVFQGKLRRVEAQTLEGAMALPDGGFSFDVRLMLRGSRVAIAQLSFNGGPMRSLLTTHEAAMFERLSGNVPPANLPAENWRLPQEKLPTIGFDLEASFVADGTGYRATAVLWFRAETDEVSGFCPDTDALRRICERIYKDGPLEMRMSLDKPAPHGTAGWHGTVSSTGWPAGTFEVDLYRGSAIADWGDEEPGAFYLRFRSPGVLPGGEEVGWLKIEPMGRAPVSLDELAERGTFDRPPAMPPAPPSGAQGLAGDACAALRARMSGLPDREARERAAQVLGEAGFWGGILPGDPEGCRRAAAALDAAGVAPAEGAARDSAERANNPAWRHVNGSVWPGLEDAFHIRTNGPNGPKLELSTDRSGRPIIRIAPFDGCTRQSDRQSELCALLQRNPGEHAIQDAASSRDILYGRFSLEGASLLLRVTKSADGKVLANLSYLDTRAALTFGDFAGGAQ
ncbi:MAG: hypothetical protein CMH69_09430 [Nitratireductor sp.]|nr:hypothetical protein [Nitratireductor sp.]